MEADTKHVESSMDATEWLRQLGALERQGDSLAIEVVLKDDEGNAAGSLAFRSSRPHRRDILLQVGATLERLAHQRETPEDLAARIASEARAAMPQDDLMTQADGRWRALSAEERTRLGLGRVATPEIEP